jgi:hypothetical protein
VMQPWNGVLELMGSQPRVVQNRELEAFDV